MKPIHYLFTLLCLFGCLTSAFADDFNSTRTDFRDESIYFVMTTRFYDGDYHNNVLCWDNQTAQIETGDPCWRGDFAGLIDKLDYIKALGFTAIWITPVVQGGSGYDYHGYHAMDFSKVDLRYESHKGTGKYDGGSTRDVDFQTLIDAAHAKGLKIVLDIVLNHTGNFGENYLCREFDRDADLLNQATSTTSLIVNEDLLGKDYENLSGSAQYQRRLAFMKNTDGKNHDNHNYWHHVGTQWNWDEPNRWWGQIAGDCVDLNTENPAVADYLVKCYGEFIKMGVDGFRIDTSGHISRLTYNKQFIPQLNAIGEQYKSKRLNGAPFYMFGEVCARYSEVTYRDQPNLSPYFYTWASDESLLSQWNEDATWWDEQFVKEGADPLGNMTLCLEEANIKQESDNALMKNGQYHEPDYSKASGFYVIDFPLHYNFSNANSAYGLAKSGDKYYNDATYNVVYVDSHDYGPQPNDGVRFGGSDEQWAENLSLMFTFRGIPCLYYGSEVGFRRGAKIDNGPNGPLSNTGRAYFGGYISGDVDASDFGEFSATGNALASLNHDLAQHLIRLNKIRQAVPALRKGQWTSDGCSSSSGIAFKRAYKESFALVALNGGATFTGCPNGTYTDIITGEKYTGTTITVKAPSNKGQVRVLVKDWTGGTIGEDGPFIYTASASKKGNQAYDGTEEEGTTYYITPEDATNVEPEQPLEEYTPSCYTDDLSIFYETSAKSVSVWIWNSSANFTGGSWDSKPTMELMGGTAEGKRIFKWKYTGTETTTPSYVIFVKNGSQSANLEYVNHGYYIDGVLDHIVEGEGEDPDDHTGGGGETPDPTENTYTAYFVNSVGWNTIYAYTWDATNGNKQYSGGWPGKNITSDKVFTNDEGYDVYKWTYTGTIAKAPSHIIFNNGSGTQTADLVFVDGGYYDFNGQTSGISNVNAQTNNIAVYTLSGIRAATVSNISDAQYILQPGIYIVNGKKVAIRTSR